MASDLFGITADTVRIGMDALSQRQAVAAQNIAQASVPGARSLRVSFANQFEAASRAADRDGQWVQQLDEAVAATPVRLAPKADALDAQVVDINQAALHYHALSRALRQHFSMLSLAVNAGRR